MERPLILLRLGCFLFGTAMGMLMPDKIPHRFHDHTKPKGVELLYLILPMTKMAVCCAVVVTATPLPASSSILYAGAGLVVSRVGKQPYTVRRALPLICSWLILYLPFTGALACLGGVMLAFAADAPGLSALAVLVFAAPMALLQFGAEGCLVLLGTALFLCLQQMISVYAAVHHIRSHPR